MLEEMIDGKTFGRTSKADLWGANNETEIMRLSKVRWRAAQTSPTQQQRKYIIFIIISI